MTNSTLEKVARAIYEAAPICDIGDLTKRGTSSPIAWERLWEGQPDYVERVFASARAALQSLREVDDETVEAMVAVPEAPAYRGRLYGYTRDVWTAAIDHILTEGGEG